MADREEKSIVEKISDAVKGVVDTASAAAMKAMQAGPDPGQVAGTTNEQVYIPEATDAAAMPAPLIPSKPAAKKKRTLRANLIVAKKATAKTSSKKAARKRQKCLPGNPRRKRNQRPWKKSKPLRRLRGKRRRSRSASYIRVVP
jgi:hypothetical protein